MPDASNVQDLDEGQMNFFLEVWTWNIHDVYKTLQTHPANGSPPLMFVYNITKAKRALWLANSASTICPWVYAADVLTN